MGWSFFRVCGLGLIFPVWMVSVLGVIGSASREQVWGLQGSQLAVAPGCCARRAPHEQAAVVPAGAGLGTVHRSCCVASCLLWGCRQPLPIHLLPVLGQGTRHQCLLCSVCQGCGWCHLVHCSLVLPTSWVCWHWSSNCMLWLRRRWPSLWWHPWAATEGLDIHGFWHQASSNGVQFERSCTEEGRVRHQSLIREMQVGLFRRFARSVEPERGLLGLHSVWPLFSLYQYEVIWLTPMCQHFWPSRGGSPHC